MENSFERAFVYGWLSRLAWTLHGSGCLVLAIDWWQQREAFLFAVMLVAGLNSFGVTGGILLSESNERAEA